MRRGTLRGDRGLEPARALELDDQHALAAPRGLEREPQGDRGAADAALPDREDEAALQEVGEAQPSPGAGAAATADARRSTRQALVPPKPNEFEIAASMAAGRAWFGT